MERTINMRMTLRGTSQNKRSYPKKYREKSFINPKIIPLSVKSWRD